MTSPRGRRTAHRSTVWCTWPPRRSGLLNSWCTCPAHTTLTAGVSSRPARTRPAACSRPSSSIQATSIGIGGWCTKSSAGGAGACSPARSLATSSCAPSTQPRTSPGTWESRPIIFQPPACTTKLSVPASVREQLGERLCECILPVVVVAGDDPVTLHPLAERLAQHVIGGQRLVLREVAGEHEIVQLLVPVFALSPTRTERCPRSAPRPAGRLDSDTGVGRRAERWLRPSRQRYQKSSGHVTRAWGGPNCQVGAQAQPALPYGDGGRDVESRCI